MKIDFQKIVKVTLKFIDDNTPALLTAAGIGGFTAAGVIAVKNTPKALDHIDDARRKKAREEPDKYFTKIDTVKACAGDYVGPVSLAAASTVCLIASHKISHQRELAVVSLLKMSQSELKEFRETTKQILGEEKAAEVEDDILEKKMTEAWHDDMDLVQGNGTEWCFDPMTSRYFMSTDNKIEQAVTRLNKRMVEDYGYISLNELYDELYIDQCEAGNILGWHVSRGLIDLHTTTKKTPSGKPCLVLVYKCQPDYRYA